MWRAGLLGLLALLAGCAQSPPPYARVQRTADARCHKRPGVPCRPLPRKSKPLPPKPPAEASAPQDSPFSGYWVGDIRMAAPPPVDQH